MQLDTLLSQISENKRITVKRVNENDVQVFIEVSGLPDILRIYPKTKKAEFLDIGDEWEELYGAVEEKYKDFPGIKKLVDYLNEEGYDISF